jgi:hypothetical protein
MLLMSRFVSHNFLYVHKYLTSSAVAACCLLENKHLFCSRSGANVWIINISETQLYNVDRMIALHTWQKSYKIIFHLPNICTLGIPYMLDEKAI